MTYDPTTDPTNGDESLDSMMAAGVSAFGPKRYFGEITVIDVWDCVLRRGQGKVPFDATSHRLEERQVAITLKITCTKKDGSSYDVDQSDLAGGARFRPTLESLKTIGITGRRALTALAGKFVAFERHDTTEKYQAKKDSNDGKIKAGDWITVQSIVVFAIYPDADACREAEAAHYSRRDSGGTFTGAQPRNAPQPITAADLGGIDTAARDMLVKSLPMLWQAAGQNAITFETMLTAPGTQFAALGITMGSPEVLEIIDPIPF